MSMYDALASGSSEPPDDSRVSDEFLGEVERKLATRMGRRVSIKKGVGILGVKVESALAVGSSIHYLGLDWLLHREGPDAWAAFMERLIRGENCFGPLAAQAEYVEELFENFARTPRTLDAGLTVVQKITAVDDACFEALNDVIARDKVYLRFDRVPRLQEFREYLREMRAMADEIGPDRLLGKLLWHALREAIAGTSSGS
ncbi:hypothetical protein GR925_01340 [Streptomyces sp. HUCO-GS316]|uniref:hypothetical protein n=1 Tax=Streptomyces sp. HUCO-GS316 TaxID=2692198 RepID=UPI00136E07A9|nr:hypothetical protein [Streptomyces sp. HUCO-GS316]MXM62128.1 hypothetical protein [Streptomyces sp. HUCO-GS316]